MLWKIWPMAIYGHHFFRIRNTLPVSLPQKLLNRVYIGRLFTKKKIYFQLNTTESSYGGGQAIYKHTNVSPQ